MILCQWQHGRVSRGLKWHWDSLVGTSDAACLDTDTQVASGPGKGHEADLAKREADLNAREAELKRWEADLRSSGRLRPKKNWPKCCPVTVMDIRGDRAAKQQASFSTCSVAHEDIMCRRTDAQMCCRAFR